MKATRFIILTAIGLVLSFLAAGCHLNPQNPKAIPLGPADTNSEVPTMPPITENTSNGPTMIELPPFGMHAGWKEDQHQFAAQTIHFAYDSSVVRSADKSKIAEV